MKINVTQEDIDRGIPESCDKCAVALAVQRETKERVTVSPEEIRIGNKLYDTPIIAAKFIESYDSLDDVSPFSFELTES